MSYGRGKLWYASRVGGEGMMTYVDFLKKVPLFSELDDEELQQIATVVREQHYKKHTTIVHVEDPGNALYILKSGLVKVTIEDRDGYEMILRLLYPTDFFGDMSLLDGEPRSATITTQEPSEVLIVSRDHFLHIIEKTPKILLKMAAVLSKRLRKTNELIHSLAFFDVYGKVARTLLNLASWRGLCASFNRLVVYGSNRASSLFSPWICYGAKSGRKDTATAYVVLGASWLAVDVGSKSRYIPRMRS